MKMFGNLLTAIILVMTGSSVFAAEPVLLLFGGSNHDKFLGCLNCNKRDSSSVWNKHGEYGSKYKADCIWNKYGTYGSKYSSESPWNKYSTEGPVVVDPDGNFYGFLTLNKHNNQTKIKWLVWILENYEYVRENLDEIRDEF